MKLRPFVLLSCLWAIGAGAQQAEPTLTEDAVQPIPAELQVLQGPEEICLPDEMPLPPGYKHLTEGIDIVDLPIELEADEITSPGLNIVELKGQAWVRRGPQQISADNLQFNNQTYAIDAEGNVVLHTQNGDKIVADRLDMELDTRIGSADESQFWFSERPPRAKKRSVTRLDDFGIGVETFTEDFTELLKAKPNPAEGTVYLATRGEAEQVFFEGHNRELMENVRITGCQAGQDDVFLDAKELTLDHATGIGTAKHLKLRFFNVPIFYFPRASFPISGERKTGFLFPKIGYRDESGFVMEVPWYWNIAPNHDATLTPTVLSQRGLQLLGQYRYLTENSEGALVAEALPSDNNFEDEDRWAVKYDHAYAKDDKWLGRVNYAQISDDDYLDDFKNDVNVTSATYLDQVGELRYTQRVWTAFGALRGFQNIDDQIDRVDEPYDSLPELGFDARSEFKRDQIFRWDVNPRLTDFKHTADEKVDGTRLGWNPNIRFPLNQIYGYLTPKLSLISQSYNLDNVQGDDDTSPSYAVPRASVDGALFFEREFTQKKKGLNFTQTLEPRIMYVYAPFEDQDDIPIFDTGDANLNNFGNLFLENRFFGNDRAGDTSRLTLGLTTRVLETETARQTLSASIGQVFFFQDQKVQLEPDDPTDTDDESNLVGQIIGEVTPSWSIGGFAQYNFEDNEAREYRIDATFDPDSDLFYYEPGRQRYFTFGYWFQRDDIDDADVDLGVDDDDVLRDQLFLELSHPITARWRVGLFERYDFDEAENLETSLGLEYDACCWLFRVQAQRRKDRGEEFRDTIFFTLEFDNLGALSSKF